VKVRYRSPAGYRFIHPGSRARGFPGQVNGSWSKAATRPRPARPARPARPKASESPIKGAQNVQIGTIRILIDVKQIRMQNGGS